MAEEHAPPHLLLSRTFTLHVNPPNTLWFTLRGDGRFWKTHPPSTRTERYWVKRGHWPILVRTGNDHGRAQMPVVPAHSDPAGWISLSGHLSVCFGSAQVKRLQQNRVSRVTDLVLRPDVVHPVSFSWNLVTGRQTQQLSWVRPGHTEAVAGGALTCWLSAFGWRSSLACRRSRSPP